MLHAKFTKALLRSLPGVWSYKGLGAYVPLQTFTKPMAACTLLRMLQNFISSISLRLSSWGKLQAGLLFDHLFKLEP